MDILYKIDFAAASAAEKADLVDDLEAHADKAFAGESAKTQILAQTLIFTRWWNSYRHIKAPDEETPEVVETAIKLLWDFLEGKCTPETLARFQKSFSAGALEIMTGDDSELNGDPESDAFYEAHFRQWPMSYNVYLSNLCLVLEGAVCGQPFWEGVQEVLYGDIGDTMIDVFEPVFTTPTGGYHPAELDRRDGDIYRSPTFCRVFALLQQDMRAALDGRSVSALRAQYRSEVLFTPEECAKLSATR